MDKVWDTTYTHEISFTTFLRNTLEKYTFGFGIFQEWLANADDAKSKRFTFVLDYDSYPANSLLSNKMQDWQGPAVLIYNDSIFSSSDWRNFTTKVGNSAKRTDPNSIGNFGLGALTAYHFTDLISVVSGTEALFLDVHKKWLPEHHSSLKGNFVEKKLAQKYPDQFKPFTSLTHFGCSLKEEFPGTIFRLPLRSMPSEVSNKIITLKAIEEMLQNVEQRVDEMLLFLQHVEEIQCFTHKEGKYTPLFSSKLSNLTPTQRIQRTMQLEEGKKVHINTVELEISTNVGNKHTVAHWLVCNGVRDSFDQTLDTNGRKAVPRGGVAIKLEVTPLGMYPIGCKGKGFCYLPLLTNEDFNLPVHLNGAFQLSDDRRTLWPGQDDKTAWNKLLLREWIAPLWGIALGYIAKKTIRPEAIYDVFPPLSCLYYWNEAADELWNILSDTPVFYCRGKPVHHQPHWVKGKDTFFTSNLPSEYRDAESALTRLGMHCIETPVFVMQKLSRQILTPMDVAEYLKKPEEHLIRLSNVPEEELVVLVKYILSVKRPNLLLKIPLLPLTSGGYGEIGNRYYLPGVEAVSKLIGNRYSLVNDSSPILKAMSRYLKELNIGTIPAKEIRKSLPNDLPQSAFTNDQNTLSHEQVQYCHEILERFECYSEFADLPLFSVSGNKLVSLDFINTTYSVITSMYVRDSGLRAYLAKKLQVYYIENEEFMPTKWKSYIQKRDDYLARLLLSKSKNIVNLLLQDIYDDDAKIFTELRSELADCKDLKDFKDAPLMKTKANNFVPFKHILNIETYLAEIVPENFNSQLLNSDFANKIFAEQFNSTVLKTNSEQFCKTEIIPLLSKANLDPFVNILRFMVKQGYCIPELSLKAFIKINGVYYKPSTLLLGDCPPIIADNILQQQRLPDTWNTRELLKKLHLCGLPKLSDIVSKCAQRLLEMQHSDKPKLISDLLSACPSEYLNELLKYPIIPAERKFEGPISLVRFPAESYYKASELFDPAQWQLVWTVGPILHSTINKTPIQSKLCKIDLEIILKHFHNLITIVATQWDKTFLLVSDLDKIIDLNLSEISQRVDNDKSQKSKVIAALENLPFIRTDDGDFVVASNLCFSLLEDMPSNIIRKVPERFKKFKNLLRSLGTEDGIPLKLESMVIPPEPANPIVPAIIKYIASQLENKQLCDVIFQLEGRETYAHRIILSCYSEKFRNQFNGVFIEGGKHQVIVPIKDYSYESFHLFLKYLYTGTLLLSQLDLEIILELAKLGNEHMIKELKTSCERYILLNHKLLIKVENVCTLYEYAENLLMDHLKEFCKNFVKNCKKAVIATNSAQSLSKEQLRELIGENVNILVNAHSTIKTNLKSRNSDKQVFTPIKEDQIQRTNNYASAAKQLPASHTAIPAISVTVNTLPKRKKLKNQLVFSTSSVRPRKQ